MDNHQRPYSRLGRRAFIRNGSLFLLGAGLGASPLGLRAAEDSRRLSRIGMVTDLHYADKPAAGSRHYRQSIAKLGEAAKRFQQDKPDCVVELGDFIDAADSVAVERGYLKRIHAEFAALPGEKHCVLGNHCVYSLTKPEFLDVVEQKRSFYSFDEGGVHFVVLDACFRGDGKPYGRKNFKWTDANIPADQVEWLRADLKQAQGPGILFVHQRLDVSNHYGVKNAPEIRKILEDSGKVLAVFQGHSHKNDVKEIGGIHYCVLTAMVEGSGAGNNGYAAMNVLADGSIQVEGFRKQKGYEW